MKKQNVIDMTPYLPELVPQPPEDATATPPAGEISNELKEAIEGLINKLRTSNNSENNQ